MGDHVSLQNKSSTLGSRACFLFIWRMRGFFPQLNACTLQQGGALANTTNSNLKKLIVSLFL